MTDDFAKDRSCQATPREELERQITSYTIAKNEREWWACREIESLRARIAELEAAIEPFRRVKAVTSIYEYVPVEALRDDETFNFRMSGAEMKTIYALLNGKG